jgi:micrococcal nuclease
MRSVSPSSVLLLLALLAISCPARTTQATLTGKVVGVTDGDTITVLVDRHPIKVRLAEIDTPEKGQPWANRAKQALSVLAIARK